MPVRPLGNRTDLWKIDDIEMDSSERLFKEYPPNF
jgi:hypothetical protein